MAALILVFAEVFSTSEIKSIQRHGVSFLHKALFDILRLGAAVNLVELLLVVIRLSQIRIFILQFGSHALLCFHVVKLLQDHLCKVSVIQSDELIAMLLEVSAKHPLYFKIRDQDALDLGVLDRHSLRYVRHFGKVKVI